MQSVQGLGCTRHEFNTRAHDSCLLLDLHFAGAVQSIFKLMQKPETRAASLTMLGQTVMLCRDRVGVGCGVWAGVCTFDAMALCTHAHLGAVCTCLLLK